MAQLPSPEATGRRILAYYVESQVRPGEMMMLRNLNAWWVAQGEFHGDDLVNGLKWLGEQGYIEQQPGKSEGALFLTDAGFAAA